MAKMSKRYRKERVMYVEEEVLECPLCNAINPLEALMCAKCKCGFIIDDVDVVED